MDFLPRFFFAGVLIVESTLNDTMHYIIYIITSTLTTVYIEDKFKRIKQFTNKYILINGFILMFLYNLVIVNLKC